jgi:hypothetical protein
MKTIRQIIALTLTACALVVRCFGKDQRHGGRWRSIDFADRELGRPASSTWRWELMKTKGRRDRARVVWMAFTERKGDAVFLLLVKGLRTL